MKRITRIIPVILFAFSFLFSCDEEADDLIQNPTPGIEYKELTPEETILKNQLADAAIILANIASDPLVLDEIVATIKIQPRIMEDRVKFANLMHPAEKLKSGTSAVGSGHFSRAFIANLQASGLKSASTLVEYLSVQGAEIYIPYPIEDYPKGTEVVVTSTPLDNTKQNIGYIIGNPSKHVMANQELTETNPVIIITPSVEYEENFPADAAIGNADNTALKSVNIDPMAVWNDVNYVFTIWLDYVYIKDDYVPDLFLQDGVIHYCCGDVFFNSSNSAITNSTTAKGNHYSQRFPRKYERDARRGYVKGMFPLNQRFILDWHPGVADRSFAWFMDLPTVVTNNSLGLNGTYGAELGVKTTEIPLGLTLKQGGSVTNTVSTQMTWGDHLYGDTNWPRYYYQMLYNSAGDTWSQIHGNAWVLIPSGGYRPVIKVNNELFYVTHCSVEPR
ncbi:MAG TPA: hypothetical protein PLK12_13130 [Prolixibacteraceae bacterium]|nr:hypothetical protein [Prolixibacteraceae bacterium]